MLVRGEWLPGVDGIQRPCIRALLECGDGSRLAAMFIADTGADRSVLSAPVFQKLQCQTIPSDDRLVGVGGEVESVLVDTRLFLLDFDQVAATFRGPFAVFTDRNALDISILGRDVTAHFAVLVDRPGDRVCLVHPPHNCTIGTA